MLKKYGLSVIIFIASMILSFSFIAPLQAYLETLLLVDGSPSSANVPYQQTQWYGFTATGGNGYCAILTSSTGNSDLYLSDTNFQLRKYSRNTGTTVDRVWYGQSASGPFHLACYGSSNPSSNFTIQVITAPYISTISPTSGGAGQLVTLTGYGFGATRGTSYIKFGTVQATNYYSWSNTQIKVYVPSGVANGIIQAVAYVASRDSNPMNFTARSISSDGTMWRYDLGRTGNYPNGPTGLPLNLKWSYHITTPYSAMDSVTVANNVVYVGSDKLYALDANTGALKWSYTAMEDSAPDGFGSCAAVAAGTIYAGTGRGFFYAIDANTGSLKWKYDARITGFSSSIVTSAIVHNGMVYFGAYGTRLYALDANTGNLKWTYDLPIENNTIDGLYHSPAIANDTIYFPTGKYVYALNANTGALRWRYQQSNEVAYTTPAIYNGVLYLTTIDSVSGGRVLAIDANTGTLKWQWGSLYHFTTAAVANGNVYLGVDTTAALALDANTGALKWSAELGGSTAIPSISNGLVYITKFRTLYALDANTGETKWSTVVSGYMDGSPAIYNGKVYVTGGIGIYGEGIVYCFGQ